MRKGSVVKPSRLQKGDTVGIVAPASSFDRENFKKGIRKLRQLGFRVRYQKKIFNKCWSQPGHNKQRAAQINQMFSDREIKAIFCAKAGYGSIEILPFLDKKIIKKNPKIFVGYSDITILLLYLQKVANMVVFHGPVVSGEIHQDADNVTIDYLLRVLTQNEPLGIIRFPELYSFKEGTACGRLVGGNLSLVAESIGSCYRIDTQDSILFLEDVNENLENLEKYILRLRRAGKLRKVRGIVLGKMVDCFQTRENLKKLIETVLKNYPIPVLFGFPSGHRKQEKSINITLPLGVRVCIDTQQMGLNITESATS